MNRRPGGWGGYRGGDGQDALINNVNGAFRDFPVEVWETKYPIQLGAYGFRPDTGGPGQWRGGCGIYREYRFETDAAVYLWFERSRTPAWGIFGGRDAVGPHNEIRGSVSVTPLKANNLAVRNGDVMVLQTGGGGGFGNPLDRDPVLVAQDISYGYVTREGAERDYGVVITAEGLVDGPETERLRSSFTPPPLLLPPSPPLPEGGVSRRGHRRGGTE